MYHRLRIQTLHPSSALGRAWTVLRPTCACDWVGVAVSSESAAYAQYETHIDQPAPPTARAGQPPQPHEYEGACRNVQHAATGACACNALVNGRLCRLSRINPIHQPAPPTARAEAGGE